MYVFYWVHCILDSTVLKVRDRCVYPAIKANECRWIVPGTIDVND